jgi:hypothetical protein
MAAGFTLGNPQVVLRRDARSIRASSLGYARTAASRLGADQTPQ